MADPNVHSFQIHEDYPEFGVQYDPTVVLQPDSATALMAIIAANMAWRNKAARFLYEGVEEAPLNVVDLGSGSGVVGVAMMAAIDNLGSITAIDADPATLPVAAQNLEAANTVRAQKGLGKAAVTVEHGDWNEAAMWQRLPSADIIISNPPYLIAGEPVRKGYEQTPRQHLYAEDEAQLTESYRRLIGNAVQRMRMWDVITIRLPKASLDRGDQWINLFGEALDKAASPDDPAYYFFQTRRFARFGERPLHAAILEKLPIDYPAMNPVADVRVDYYMRRGEDIGMVASPPNRCPNEVMFIRQDF